MGILPAVLAGLVGSGLPTPAQQQMNAAAVYLVHHEVIAYGEFARDLDDEITLVTNVDEKMAMEGTAFAVDQDGWLITARHVVDPTGLARDFCGVMAEQKPYSRYRVDSIKLDMSLTDIVGNTWVTRFTVTPAPGSPGDICAAPADLQVESENFWPIVIVKMDDVADLALMKLTQSAGPLAAIPFGTMADFKEWQTVYAFGFPGAGNGALSMVSGLLINACEERLSMTSATEIAPGIVRADILRMTRYLMEGRQGFSGGPIAAAGRLAGVTTMAGPTQAEPQNGIASVGLTFAVPVDYVHAWYLWARGLSSVRPTEVCTP